MTDKIVIESCLQLFFHRFQTNPFNYLYESDLQAHLNTMLDTSIGRSTRIVGIGKYYDTKAFIETSIVKTEYPSGNRFDIAVIDPDGQPDYPEVNTKKLKHEKFWVLPIRTAIEIKYCQLGDRLSDRLNQLYADVNKINNYRIKNNRVNKTNGICLLFVQADKISQFERIHEYGKEKLPDNIEIYVIGPQKVYSLKNWNSPTDRKVK